MNKKMAFLIIALATFAMFVGIVRAQIKTSIQVKDSEGKSISGATVPIGTVAYVYGYYEDLIGSVSASALMEVYYDDGSGWKYMATLFSGSVNDGQTVVETYTMTVLGYYEFRWACEIGSRSESGSNEIGPLCRQEKAMARTTIQLVVPEPGTLAGLAMALAAFGFLAVTKTRVKKVY